MKKLLKVWLLGIFILGIVSFPGYGQDGAKILDKVITATGGRELLESIQDTTFSGTMDLVQMGMSGSITIYHKEPNMSRQDMIVMGMNISSAFDGERGWGFNPQTGAIEDLPGSLLENARNDALGFGNSWMLYPEKYGISLADKGRETINGKIYVLLEVTFENGDTSLYYIDTATFLPYKIRSLVVNQMGMEVLQESILGNYKDVDGYNFAHSITILQDGENFGSIVIDEVKFNSGLQDTFFKK